MKHDFIPQNLPGFLGWLTNLLEVVRAHLEAWKLNLSTVDELGREKDELSDLYARSQAAETRTPLVVKQKNTKFAELKKKVRAFVRFNLQNNELMTDEGRIKLGITVQKKRSAAKKQPVPSSRPHLKTAPAGNCAMSLHVSHQAVENAAEAPPEAAIARVLVRHGVYQNGAGAPAHEKELPEVRSLPWLPGKTCLKLQFPSGEQGSHVYYAACFENHAGEQGPWSPLTRAVIA
jgi:hypothetical protein